MKYYSAINSIIIYIESRVKSEISYSDMEKNIGFSLVHIRSIFRNYFKMPLARYILHRKIANAAYEIVYCNKRLTDIAYSYGFDGYDSFTRAFKRIVGVTPTQHRKNPCNVSIAYISSGVYAPVINKEDGVSMDIKLKKENGECILYGFPSVDFGYGVNSTFPSCLKACLDYLGQPTSNDYLMVASGAAFRLRWNTELLDLGNVSILNLYEDAYKPFDLCFKSVNRHYSILKRAENITKNDFMKFIKKEINEGRPCIALGIIGPPEACVITGYRNNCDDLLGYSLFQNEPQFCTNTTIDSLGYFVCSDWWENTETKALIAIGETSNNHLNFRSISDIGIKVLSTNNINQFLGGSAAYKAVINFIEDDRNWSTQLLHSRLFEQIIVLGDIMVMICNRKAVANYIHQINPEDNTLSSKLNELAEIFNQTSEIPEKMTALAGGWDMSERMLEYMSTPAVRKKLAEYLTKAMELDKRALNLLIEINK